MQTFEGIREKVKRLPKAEQELLRDWLENFLEDDREFTDEFQAKIERGEQDIRAGRVRIHKPSAVEAMRTRRLFTSLWGHDRAVEALGIGGAGVGDLDWRDWRVGHQ